MAAYRIKALAAAAALLLALSTAAPQAARAAEAAPLRQQTFADAFMRRCRQDTTVVRVTISRQMLGQILQSPAKGQSREAAIRKLTGASLITCPSEATHYRAEADALLRKYSALWRHYRDFTSGTVSGSFYLRRDRDGRTRELILLREDTAARTLQIVCLTGDIDDEFISLL